MESKIYVVAFWIGSKKILESNHHRAKSQVVK